MVRFHWHVEDGRGAFATPNGTLYHEETGVQHSVIEIEKIGGRNAEGILSIPPHYMCDSSLKDVGVVFAHGQDASEWRGPLLSTIATHIAKSGYPVMRYHCRDQSEKSRQQAFELALSVAASSPYARTVKRWVLMGVGTGAKVAAAVGNNCRGNIAGFVLISYPLMEVPEKESEAAARTSGEPSTSAASSAPELHDLMAPVLFMRGQHDKSSSSSATLGCVGGMKTWDVRLAEIQGVDGNFCLPSKKELRTSTIEDMSNTILNFIIGISCGRMDVCKAPRVKIEPGPAAESTSQRPLPSNPGMLQVMALNDKLIASIEADENRRSSLQVVKPPGRGGRGRGASKKEVDATEPGSGSKRRQSSGKAKGEPSTKRGLKRCQAATHETGKSASGSSTPAAPGPSSAAAAAASLAFSESSQAQPKQSAARRSHAANNPPRFVQNMVHHVPGSMTQSSMLASHHQTPHGMQAYILTPMPAAASLQQLVGQNQAVKTQPQSAPHKSYSMVLQLGDEPAPQLNLATPPACAPPFGGSPSVATPSTAPTAPPTPPASAATGS